MSCHSLPHRPNQKYHARTFLIMEPIFRWPRSVLLCCTTLLTPESSLWAKQQFPRGSCQAEIAVISGAHIWGRQGHPWKYCELIFQVENVGLYPQPDSRSRAAEPLLMPKHLHETHSNSSLREDPGMRSLLPWWPGGTKARTFSKRELWQVS